MTKHARDHATFRWWYKFVLRITVAVLFLQLTIFTEAPAWGQTTSRSAFEEVEKQATEARDAGHLEDAVTLYRQGLRLKPSWTEGSWYLGTSLYGLKRYAEARDAFRHLALSQPGNARAWGLAGICEYELKNYNRALEYLLRSETGRFGENDELAYLIRFRIALLLNRSGEHENALDRLIPIAAMGTYPEVIGALGLSLLRVRLLPSEVPDQDRDLYTRAGEAMNAYVTHDTEGAARLFEELVVTYPERINVHYAYGSFLMETSPEKAMREFQRELELNPSHVNSLLQMAKLYLKQGAPEKALASARLAVKAEPVSAAAHRLSGESLLESGSVAAAIQELGTAARLAPDFPQTHFLLAEAHKRAGNKTLAIKEMTEFQRLDKKEKSKLKSQ